jgi:hypothetical protein
VDRRRRVPAGEARERCGERPGEMAHRSNASRGWGVPSPGRSENPPEEDVEGGGPSPKPADEGLESPE